MVIIAMTFSGATDGNEDKGNWPQYIETVEDGMALMGWIHLGMDDDG